ncbi:Uma2 family endonuclease [Pseudanabaena sp. PCC 6802]|uniref:Uma2 family endonuclease n=1 Tax=Pseudanabaena sp. PCC 6802 TaxID=118173 RepID=UPI0004777FE6|nr:Uma2 family endonuclease [Pseudanabaena sp. PCC 6802]
MTQIVESKTKLLTFDEFLAYEDGTDTRYELVDGELVEMPAESDVNATITRLLFVELLKFFSYLLIAWGTEIEVSGQRSRCRLPDLIVHTEASKAALTGASRSLITRDMPPPALVIEVVSPGVTNRSRDYRHKRTEYAARGISEYWIVDPEEQRITVCKWVDGQYEDRIFTGNQLIESDVVSGFSLTPQQIFEAAR